MILSRLVRSLLALALITAPLAAQRERFNFNQGWLVETGDPGHADEAGFNDSGWKHVTLPYAWNEDSAFRVSIHDLPTGIAWYRKHFQVPAGAKGQRVVLEFEGVRMAGEVFLNGRRLGIHEDGVSAFGFDITDEVKGAGEDNVLAVRTDNSWKYKEVSTGTAYHWNDSNFYANYGGINRNVWLHVMGPVHQTLPLYSNMGTTGTYVWASDFDLAGRAAKVTAETQVKNEGAKAVTLGYRVRVVDKDGRVVARFQGKGGTLAAGETKGLAAAAVVHGLQFWSWGYGSLYDVVTTLTVGGKVVDEVTTRTGFRKEEFDHGALRLNGRTLEVHGYAQRTTNEWPGLGVDLPPWVSDLSNRMMVEGNGDLVRWMHVTPSRQDTDSTDRVGLLVSMPAGDSEGDSKGRQWEQRVELMRASIVYNRNNPSVFFYESGNKGITDEHMAEMKAVRDTFDPHGGRAIGARDMLASTTAEYGGEMLYIDKSATKPLWAHEYNRDEGARAFWDDETEPFHGDSPLYNRNQDSAAIEDVVTWDDYFRARPGTGRRVSAGGVNIVFADSNTHYRGDNNYRRSGEVDGMRLPKDGFYAHRVMWNGWVEPEVAGVRILGHWNYKAGTVKPVYVVAAKVARVDLVVNGKTVGSVKAMAGNPNGSRAGMPAMDLLRTEPNIPAGQSNDFLFSFPAVRFEAGVVEAVGFDHAGKRVAAHKLETAGVPVGIRLTPHVSPTGLHADGADLALVDVEIVDAAGRRCPTVAPVATFRVAGPVEWRGGIGQGTEAVAAPLTDAEKKAANPTIFLHEDNHILAKTLPIEDGINRVTLRALPGAGLITLTASVAGLPDASITLRSKAVAEVHGLSRFDPAKGLPLYLERGPTPAGDSVRATRAVIGIVSASAGSKEADAKASYDDNETTAWASDGMLAHAWIEYTLPAGSAPTELELKLNAFRTRRYPLRVTLDGTTVFEGTTPNSLGYTLIPLKAGTGSHLRIVLTGVPVDGAQGAGTAEITGKYDGAGVAPVTRDGKAVLNVIEAEVYGSGR